MTYLAQQARRPPKELKDFTFGNSPQQISASFLELNVSFLFKELLNRFLSFFLTCLGALGSGLSSLVEFSSRCCHQRQVIRAPFETWSRFAAARLLGRALDLCCFGDSAASGRSCSRARETDRTSRRWPRARWPASRRTRKSSSGNSRLQTKSNKITKLNSLVKMQDSSPFVTLTPIGYISKRGSQKLSPFF